MSTGHCNIRLRAKSVHATGLAFVFLSFILSALLLLSPSAQAAPGLKKPQLLEPKGGFVTASTLSAFVWRAVDGATGYSLEVSQGGVTAPFELTAAEAGCEAGGTCSYMPPDLVLQSGKVHWQVQAGDGNHVSRWSGASFQFALNAPGNKVPVADDQSVSTNEDQKSDEIILTGSDVDGDALTFRVVTQPANGSLIGTAPNLTYAPNLNFNGTDSFSFGVNDGIADSAPATVTVTVNPIPEQPQNLTATPGDAQVELSWESVADATGYEVCQATESITDAASCSALRVASVPL
ncbi:MAG: cadherin-like domain-containing protein [Thiolinea sp.]